VYSKDLFVNSVIIFLFRIKLMNPKIQFISLILRKKINYHFFEIVLVI